MSMICNYLIEVQTSNKNMTNVILSISKITLLLDDLAKKIGKIEVTPLSVETKTNKYGTVFIQTIFKDDSLKNIFMEELKALINAVMKKYGVEITIKEISK